MEAAAGANVRRRLQSLLRAARGGDVADEIYRNAAEEALKAAERLADAGHASTAIEHYRAIDLLFAERATNQAKAALSKAKALAARPAEGPATRQKDSGGETDPM